MSDRPGRILVVDDDRLVLATLSHGLKQAGHEVFDADNGDDAILLARQHRPELALLDIRMEGMTGFDVAAYLRDHLGIPFMFLSAFADEQTAARVRELGAVAYLTKPLDVRRVVPTVAAALAQRRGVEVAAGATVADGSATAAGLRAAPPDLVAISVAVGLHMQRDNLDRHTAFARLEAQARAGGRSLDEEAQAIVDAHERRLRGARP